MAHLDEKERVTMETLKLYYNDAFMRAFDATVLSCEALKKGFAVVLDRTAFYPEGFFCFSKILIEEFRGGWSVCSRIF